MRAIGKILYVLFVVLLVGVAGVFLASLLPIPGNIQIKIVKSGSMEPTIRTGSIVIVKPAASYVEGDVITFGEDSRDQIPTTHRILEVKTGAEGTEFVTKGDANEEADQTTVPARVVIGKVLVDVPYAGYILDFARKPVGFTLMIGVPAGIIIIDEVWRIIWEVAAIRRRKRQAAGEVTGHND